MWIWFLHNPTLRSIVHPKSPQNSECLGKCRSCSSKSSLFGSFWCEAKPQWTSTTRQSGGDYQGPWVIFILPVKCGVKLLFVGTCRILGRSDLLYSTAISQWWGSMEGVACRNFESNIKRSPYYLFIFSSQGVLLPSDSTTFPGGCVVTWILQHSSIYITKPVSQLLYTSRWQYVPQKDQTTGRWTTCFCWRFWLVFACVWRPWQTLDVDQDLRTLSRLGEPPLTFCPACKRPSRRLSSAVPGEEGFC